jgi:para-aminobenzoate synthetase/4-amino-4-deoxychorismate lyase
MINRAIFFNKFDKEWIEFKNPIEEFRANAIEDVIPILKDIDDRINDKIYLAGFISYEAAPAFDSALKAKNASSFPLCWFGLYDKKSRVVPPDYNSKSFQIKNWNSSISEEKYRQNFQKIREYIRGGYSYQVNYTYRLRSKFAGDPYAYFWDLYQKQNTAYAAYIDIDNFIICSVSPELFFRLDDDLITSLPMKGTASRGRTLREDAETIKNLYRSVKDRAENTMIVDMIRNDLGRISETGTVQVGSMYDVETYQTVLQMTSSVQAKTTASLSRILSAMFPCASITGAPKYKTTEIISELESSPRNIYTGTIGFVLPDRKAQFNVAIRTALIDKKRSTVEYGVGGGIVWDSECKIEYEETRTKIKVLTERAKTFDLLETILWTPDDGYFLRDYHLKRLSDSAKYFAFSLNRDEIEQKLNDKSNYFNNNSNRVRIRLSKNGQTKIISDVIQNGPLTKPVRLEVAHTRVNSSNPLLFHKTTNRQLYENAKKLHPDSDDVILVNERGEITETTIYNIVIKIKGNYITPKLSCGLLPGTYRAWLLDNKKIKEDIIPLDQIRNCDQIFVINSVRKWRKAVLI